MTHKQICSLQVIYKIPKIILCSLSSNELSGFKKNIVHFGFKIGILYYYRVDYLLRQFCQAEFSFK